MYATPYAGLGRATATIYGEAESGRTLAELCQDTLFRMQNREACGQDIDPVTRETIPQPVTTTYPTVAPEPVIAPPSEPTGESVTTTAPTDQPAVQPEATTTEGGTEVVTTGGGGGWSAPSWWTGGGGGQDVSIVTEGGGAPPLEERGYGLLEVAMAAGLAWVLSRAYRGG